MYSFTNVMRLSLGMLKKLIFDSIMAQDNRHHKFLNDNRIFHYFRDHKILELLYEEAKYNILTGRYPCEISDYIMLGGIQARLELGPYDMTVHTPSYFRTIMYRLVHFNQITIFIMITYKNADPTDKN